MTTTYDYDYIVLGGGSGGIASAKRAAGYGAKVALIEKARLGGTCVNVGCVPKKVMFAAASIATTLNEEASQYGFEDDNNDKQKKRKVNWRTLKQKRDAYVQRLNGIYGDGLDKTGVDVYVGEATFMNDHTISILQSDNGTTKSLTASKILIAVGGRPAEAIGEGVAENSINSDGFFDLPEQPEVVVVVGAGYIAVELAGVLQSLGSEVHLVTRKERALRNFDPDIAQALQEEMMKEEKMILHPNTGGGVSKIENEKNSGKKIVTLANGDVIYGVDVVLMATGRVPNTETLNLEEVGIVTSERGHIVVDEYQNTSNPNIFALGDACGRVELTPMAIAAGRRLSDRLFNAQHDAKVSYEEVPTVVFSHPTIGTIGLTEPQAREKYGTDEIKIYKSKFANLFYGIYDTTEKPKTFMKVITAGKNVEKVVGIHIMGKGADEMLQGFGVAMKMGATKADLDSCIAIHPTAAEELVTMGTWGTAPSVSGAKQSPWSEPEDSSM